jgi:hypothetical protein
LIGVPLGIWARRGLHHLKEAGQQVKTGVKPGWGLLLCGFSVGCTGQGIVASTLGLMLKREFGETVDLWGISLGVATLTGLLLAGRWIADLMAPVLGAITDRLGRPISALIFFEMGAFALTGGVWLGGPVALVMGVLLFYINATGVAISLSSEAGSRGSKSLASYVTASDCGSAAGPILGCLVLFWEGLCTL